MAENIVVNGVTYNGVDSIAMQNTEGQAVGFYPDAVRYSAQALTEAQKAQARKNIGAQAELTQADQEAIVQQVIAALGTPVFGRVDADKNIILSVKNLADGTYTLWTEDEEGKVAELCTLVHSSNDPTYTNLANPSSSEWVEGSRINSSGAIVGSYTGSVIANFIPCKNGDVVRVKGMDIAYYQASSVDVGRTNMWYYQSDKSTSVGKIVVADTPSVFVNSGDVWTFTVGNGLSGDTSKIAYIRPFGRYMSGYTKNNVIITVNEEIA